MLPTFYRVPLPLFYLDCTYLFPDYFFLPRFYLERLSRHIRTAEPSSECTAEPLHSIEAIASISFQWRPVGGSKAYRLSPQASVNFCESEPVGPDMFPKLIHLDLQAQAWDEVECHFSVIYFNAFCVNQGTRSEVLVRELIPPRRTIPSAPGAQRHRVW
jgi:hypothetical protein